MTLGSVETTALFAAIFAFLHVVFTLRVGVYRMSKKINFGDGGEKELLKRIRGHGNFTENVPMGLIILLLNELNGLSEALLMILGGVFLLGRLLHYFAVIKRLPVLARPLSMMMTLGSILTGAVLLII